MKSLSVRLHRPLGIPAFFMLGALSIAYRTVATRGPPPAARLSEPSCQCSQGYRVLAAMPVR